MSRLALMPLPGGLSCGAGPLEKGATGRIRASVRRALFECSGQQQVTDLVAELEKMLFRTRLAAIDAYDPKSVDGFVALLETLASAYPGKSASAEILGVSSSTFYRWKAGEVVPHLLVRQAVKERVIGFMTGSDEFPESGQPFRVDSGSGGLSVN